MTQFHEQEKTNISISGSRVFTEKIIFKAIKSSLAGEGYPKVCSNGAYVFFNKSINMGPFSKGTIRSSAGCQKADAPYWPVNVNQESLATSAAMLPGPQGLFPDHEF